MTGYIKVRNFEKFQHYKDRNPPWIKLYNDLLDDYEFGCLQDASKMHLIGIWLLASRSENRIPNDPEWIAKRINATSSVDIEALVLAGFITIIGDDSNVLAERKQGACLETEGETETDNTLAAEAPRESEPESKPHKKSKLPSKPRPRDPVWDALVVQCGDPETKSERGDYNRTVKELKQARASPDEMAAFPDWWRRTYPNAKLTHRCFRGHWGQYLASDHLKSTPQLDSYENWNDPEVFERLTT